MNTILKTMTSQRIAAMLAITLLPVASAWADWTAIGVGSGSDPSEYTAYVDFDTITIEDKNGSIWAINDFKVPKSVSGKSIASTKTHIEYMCQQNKKRMLEFSWHSENMGNGEVIFTKNEVDVWRDFTIDSIDDKRRNIACGKLKKTSFP